MDAKALNDAPSPPARPRHKPSRRWTLAVVVLLLLIWAVGIFFRMEIRAHWWAYRLTRVESPEARRYYLACLVAVGDKSLGAMDRLLHDPRPEMRETAVTVLEHCTSDRAADSLLGLLSDPDEDVAVKAALALASRRAPSAMAESLRGDLFGSDSDGASARRAAVILQRIGGGQARDMLIDALRQAADPDLRAQIIDSLGMLADEQAVGPLIDMLADERRVGILPYSQRCALRALDALEGRLLSEGIDPEAVNRALQAETTVASVAARSLRLITGVSFGDPATQPAEDADVIRRQWQCWWDERTAARDERNISGRDAP